MARHLLLVHGAWQGARDWDPLAPLLTERGFVVHVIDLPSSGRGRVLGDLHDDAAAVREAVGAIDGPVTLVGHSYGGMVITEASAESRNVDRLIYVAAFMLPVGVSILRAVGGVRPPWWMVDEQHRTVDVTDPTALFYQDCAPDVAARAVARLRLQSLDSFEQPLAGAGWTTIPSAYVICENDAAIPPARQEEMAENAAVSVRMPTGHSAALVDPVGLSRHIATITAGG